MKQNVLGQVWDCCSIEEEPETDRSQPAMCLCQELQTLDIYPS